MNGAAPAPRWSEASIVADLGHEAVHVVRAERSDRKCRDERRHGAPINSVPSSATRLSVIRGVA